MENKKVGISDIAVYIPRPKIGLEHIMSERIKSNIRLSRHFDRAIRVTGQRSIRFPEPWEDSATMAAQASLMLTSRLTDELRKGIRYITVGTETGVDHSKPISAYVQGMLESTGIELPRNLSSYQVQHACAGGTIAMLSVAAMLQVSGRNRESGLAICSDIARYQTHSTAELTQGAGSVALSVDSDPSLIELDISSSGYASKDVDDFFRPLGSEIAKVKGQYSIKCYNESLESAFLDHCARRGESPQDVLYNTDYFALHTPFHNMPETAMSELLESQLSLNREESVNFLKERSFYDGVGPIGDIGNIYSGSVYAVLAFMLWSEYKKDPRKLPGKKVLLASYGSGNTMVVISGRINEKAASVIANWDLDSALSGYRNAAFGEYERWARMTNTFSQNQELHNEVPIGYYHLSQIREDGYREYQYKKPQPNEAAQAEASRHLHGSVAVYR